MGLDHRACIILKPVHGYVCDRDESQERESFHKGVTGRGEAGQGRVGQGWDDAQAS